MYRAKQLREERAALHVQAQGLLTKAETEKRSLTADESAQFDRIHADIDAKRAELDCIEKQNSLDSELRGAPRPETCTEATEGDNHLALRAWCMTGVEKGASEAEREAAHRSGLNVNKRSLSIKLSNSAPKNLGEARALSHTTGSAGEYTIPQSFRTTLEVAMLQYGNVRQEATLLRTEAGNPLPMPTVNDTANIGEIVGENTAADPQDTTFGQVTLGAYKYSSKVVLVPTELLQDNAVDLPAYLGNALGVRIGRKQNLDCTTGTGSSQPTGVVTAATLGVTGASGETTSITFDDIVNLEHSVDPAYRPNAIFMLHDSTVKALKHLKDSYGRPLWLPGYASNDPDTILGYRYVVNQQMPVMAASAKSVLFGDFSKYFVRDVQNIQLLRLDELYAVSAQVAFLAFARMDANLLDAGTHPICYFQNSAS
jgi:HK97 family phage major capsid protein